MSFDAFFRAEHQRLSALATALCGDREAGCDVAQEALARAYQSWDRVGQLERPGGWTRRVVVNLAHDHGRHLAVRHRRLSELANRIAGDGAADVASLDGEMWAAVAMLPERQRTAVALFYIGDRSVSDVAEPAAWSPDGRYLIVNEQWEDQTAWVIDPWSGSGEPITGTEGFLDGACFMSDRVIAHRTWNVGYGQGDAQPGVIRLTSLDTGSTIAEIGDDLFGDGFRCHPDGSVSYLRRPVVEVERSPDFSQPEPDYDAPVDLVHIAPDGTTSVVASGDLRMV